MLKKLFKLCRKIILAILFIYAYNKLALPLNLLIPINYLTIGLVTFCGIPSILMLVLFSLLCI